MPAEALPYVSQFLVDSLLLQVACPCISKVGNKLDEAAHIGAVGSGAAEEAGSSGGSHYVSSATPVVGVILCDRVYPLVYPRVYPSVRDDPYSQTIGRTDPFPQPYFWFISFFDIIPYSSICL